MYTEILKIIDGLINHHISLSNEHPRFFDKENWYCLWLKEAKEKILELWCWWTSVFDELPEFWEECILINWKQQYIWRLWVDSEDKYRWNINNSFWYTEIEHFTHWMYLPLLPKSKLYD